AFRSSPGRHRVVVEYVTFVDPHFDTNAAKGGQGFGSPVIDIGTQRITRDAAFALPLAAGHICTCQTTADLDADALRTLAHGLTNRAFDGAAVTNAALKLTSDIFRDQVSVHIGLVDFGHFHFYFLAIGQRFQILTKLLDRLALAPDHNTGAGSVDVNQQLIGIAFDFHARNPRAIRHAQNKAADTEIFLQCVFVAIAFGVPARIPVTVYF